MTFRDRHDAGDRLAKAVQALGLGDPVILALPRGGVPVAAAVAKALGAPLDLVMVRKIGTPRNPELAAGAVVDGPAPVTVFNTEILRHLGLAERDLSDTISRELAVIKQRRALYLGGRAPVALKGRDAVVVDDGIATGATMKAALKAVRAQATASLTLAVPVAPMEAKAEMRPLVDHLVILETPEPFYAVGQHFQRFGQTSDDDVIAALAQ